MSVARTPLPLLAALSFSLAAPRASAALPNCKPETVLKAASGERQAMLLRALDFYSFYPGYSETRCLNVVTGATKKTSGSYSGGCAAAAQWWRTDCSGFASFVWGLAKSYNCKGLSTQGKDAAGHSWATKSYADLEPGDALNKTDQHVMIFTGWLDDAHTKMCTIQELNPTQADKDGVIGCTTWPWKVSDLQSTSPAYVPIGLNDTSRFNPNPAQPNANEYISLLNLPDGGAEAFARTPGGDLIHTSSASGDAWSSPDTLQSGVACGSTVGYWPHVLDWPNRAEVFSPTMGGGASHTFWADGSWSTPSPLGTLALSHLQSVVHFDGNLEVFALGADGAVYSNLGDRWSDSWSDWQSLGGSFRSGPSAIVWNDGHTEIFAITSDGEPQHNWTEAGAWHGWVPMSGELASRPVPVRWPDGHVELFATGVDGKLQHASSSDGTWTPFEDIDPTTTILGAPSAVMRVAGPAVFARSTSGRVVELEWDGAQYGSFSELGEQATVADPMAWSRNDGSIEVFALDGDNQLVNTRFDGTAWSDWAPLGATVDACVAPQLNEPPSGPATGAGGSGGRAGAGPSASPDAGSEDPRGSCGCSIPEKTDPSASIVGLLLALGLVVARRRSSAKLSR